MSPRTRRYLAVASTAFIGIGCGDASGPTASAVLWGNPRNAVEELAIGALEGPDETTFGFISDVVPDSSDALYVFSSAPSSLRYFDHRGQFIRQLGREGSGPGEYLQTVLGLGQLRDGRLVMRDQENGRFNVYNPDGSYAATWVLPTNLYIRPAMTVDATDHIFLKALIGRRRSGEPWPIGLLQVDNRGRLVDTIPPPTMDGEPAGDFEGYFRAAKHWTFSQNRQIIIGVSDAYRFEIRALDGAVVEVERDWSPVPLEPDERQAWQAFQDRQQRTLPMQLRPVPTHKPAFKGIHAGVDGTIWVELHTTAQRVAQLGQTAGRRPSDTWPEPVAFDVFESDGSYLGVVRVPPRTRILVFSRTRLWGARLGEFDEQYAVRLRVESGNEAP